MPRIVSLLPSATEIVCALGFERDLVGRSHECDFPASVKRLPALTEAKFNPAGASAEIDQRVKQIVREALSVYRVDAPRLREFRPDVIVTQSQCEVCAVNQSDVEAAVADWLGTRPKIVSLAPYALDDVFIDMQRTADALGAPARGVELVGSLRARLAAIADRARKQANSRPTVATIEWIDPLMAAGNWMPTLVEMAGGVNLFGAAGEHSPWMKFDELAARNPEVILISPCGFDMNRAAEDLPALTSRPEWPRLGAVRERRVFMADGNQYFNRPGPRIAESLEILAEIVHPELFGFGHEGTGWRRL
ncbi:MAG: cobalamin-binding protein [Candidatus Binatus sp.]|uniref:cobalamin-binding protein n=1 Tax=Candidatus Binatus sp. TaxID=2811406 RepID=UPI0027200453|nr:cobalamin-binding protein [Candidatus Binatus sp.]MDO8430968.1 cobalamin-binding protein [Candidatus Binatus sp.]